jgi:NADPH2:quinone reductase
MRAAYYETNGAARAVLRLAEVETPSPGPGEVRVKLAASGVNPSDVKSRQGLTRKIAFPRVIPHSDGAGVIDAVGEGVSQARIGERVWVWNGQWKRPFGTAAEFIALPQSQAVRLPDHVSFEQGACLGIPAMTAAHAVAASGASEGTAVLVSGGAGGVGNYAIQFAKAHGATVFATISSEAKAKLARTAGADHVIDYKRDDVGARIKDIVHTGADVAIELDINANAGLLPIVLRPRASVIVYGVGALEGLLPVQAFLVNQFTLRFIFVYELSGDERAAAIAEITRMLQADRLVHNVAATFPLDEVAAAHEAVESGTTAGNVVVTL